MASTIWKSILSKYFMTVLEGDMQCEGIRQDLASNVEFYPSQVFNKLDIDAKNFLSLNDFRAFLTEKNANFSEESLRKFIHNYDRDRDFAISFDELMNILIPRESEELRNVALERRNYNEENSSENQKISNSVEETICRLLLRELSLVEELANIADELKNSKDFTTYEAFISVDTVNSKYISAPSLRDFLQSGGFNVSQRECQDIIFRLDNDGDGQVSYEEFQEIFFPLKYAKSSIQKSSYINKYDNTISQSHIFNNTQSSSLKYSNSNFVNNYNRTWKNEGEDRMREKDDIEVKYEDVIKDENRECNDLSHNPLKSTYTDNFAKFNSQSQGKFYETQSKYHQKSPSTHQPRENNFFSTMSTIKMASPLRSSMNEEVNLKASMNTYTSPNRRFYSPGYERANRGDINNSFNLNKSVRDNSFASKRFFSPNRMNLTSNNFGTIQRNRNVHSSLSPNRTTNYNNYSKNFRGLGLYSPSYYQSSLNSKRLNLAKFLKDILVLDSNSEIYKESLALKSDVNLQDLFALFDFSNRNSISLVDFKEVLKEFDIYSTLNELKLVFKRYDINMDGRLDFDEFCEMISPKKYEYAKLLRNRYPNEAYYFDLSYESKKNLTLLFRSIIEGEVSSELKRKILNSAPDFSSYENFEVIKGKFKTSILREDLYNFLQDNGFFITAAELELLFDRLDKNHDEKITFNEFIHELVPRYTSI